MQQTQPVGGKTETQTEMETATLKDFICVTIYRRFSSSLKQANGLYPRRRRRRRKKGEDGDYLYRV